MNMNILDKISYKEKKLIVSETLLLYSRMNKMKNQQLNSNGRANDIVKQSIARNFRGASIIETIFSLLSTEYAIILENDFVKESEPF